MYIEYACYDKEIVGEIKQSVFAAVELNVGGLSIPSLFLSEVKDFLPHGLVLSCPIDYPNGWSDIKIRAHEIVKAVHKGANAVDLVVNTSNLINGRKKAFEEDLRVQQSICKENNINLRVMIDYRKIQTMDVFKEGCNIIKSLGIEYGFSSTGMYTDDHIDIITLCGVMESLGISSICNGNVFLKEHYESVQKSGIFGVRFSNINALKRCIT